MLSNNVSFSSFLSHIFETSGWNNITFGSQGDIGIIHSFSDFDLGMTPCCSAGRPFTFELKTLGEKGRLLSVPAFIFCITWG